LKPRSGFDFEEETQRNGVQFSLKAETERNGFRVDERLKPTSKEAKCSFARKGETKRSGLCEEACTLKTEQCMKNEVRQQRGFSWIGVLILAENGASREYVRRKDFSCGKKQVF
jgi:hypothetical protein